MITMTPNPDTPVSAPKTEQKAKRAAKKALEERAAKKALEEVKQQLEAPQDVWDRLIKAQEQQILGVLQEGAMEVAGQAHPKLRVMTGEEINAAYLALLNIASSLLKRLPPTPQDMRRWKNSKRPKRDLGNGAVCSRKNRSC